MEESKSLWEGYENMDKVFIFSVLPLLTIEHLPSPTKKLPLGTPFPGQTYSDDQNPNWVGHLVNTWAPEKQLLIYNFAQGGDTVWNMEQKISELYRELIKTKCKLGDHWSPAKSLFVFWIGINDLVSISDPDDVKSRVKDLFDCVETVYETGARAFLFINVPPVERSPTVVNNKTQRERFASSCVSWNTCLNEAVRSFSNNHSDAQCFEFSSYKCLNDILDSPISHGFNEEDVTQYGGKIWVDNIHLTGAVHEIIAQDIWSYLMTI